MHFIERFVKFARSKPANETYEYIDTRNCPLAQFLKAEGHKDVIVTDVHYYYDSQSVGIKMPEELRGPLHYALDYPTEPRRTWGGLLNALKREGVS